VTTPTCRKHKELKKRRGDTGKMEQTVFQGEKTKPTHKLSGFGGKSVVWGCKKRRKGGEGNPKWGGKNAPQN